MSVRRPDTSVNISIYNEPNQYGLYEYCVKYKNWKYDWEVMRAILHFLGEWDSKLCQFQKINKIVGRPVKAYRAGEQNGWLVVNTHLTNEELSRLDEYVEHSMKELPEFLRQERYTFENEVEEHNRRIR